MDQPKIFDNQSAVRLAKTLSFTSKVSTRCEAQFREGEKQKVNSEGRTWNGLKENESSLILYFYFQTLIFRLYQRESVISHTQICWEVKNMCLSDSAVFWFYLFHDNIKFIFLCFCCLQFILLLNNGSRIKQFLLKSTIVFELSYYGHYETPISWTDIPTYIRASAHSLSNHISPIKIYSCLCPMFCKFHFFDIISNTIS